MKRRSRARKLRPELAHKPPPVVLLDGDVLLMVSAARAVFEENWDDQIYSKVLDLKEAQREVLSYTRAVMDTIIDLYDKAPEIIMCLSAPSRDYWRRDVLPTYKANRKPSSKPPGYKMLEAWMGKGLQGGDISWKAKLVDRLEGDDVIGIYATGKTFRGREIIMASTDKDMLTIPGSHLNLRRREEGIRTVGKVEAMYHHMMQTLTGDSGDCYKGCPGVGPVKAARILQGVQEGYEANLDPNQLMRDWWVAVVAAYERAGLTEEDALQQARVARILQAGDYNAKTGEIKLWEPTRE